MASQAPSVVSIFDLKPCKYGSMEEYAVFLSRALVYRGWRSVLVFSRPPIEAVARDLEAAGAKVEVFAGGGFRPSRSLKERPSLRMNFALMK